MKNNRFFVGFATAPEELDEVYKLRYEDMVLEYCKENVVENCRDVQSYDEYSKHIIVKDLAMGGGIVGYYRMITGDALTHGKTFVCEEEFNIDCLKKRDCRIAEFSRAVIKKEYRGGIVVLLLWQFILNYMKANNYRYLIGDASFFGIDRDKYVKEISYLVNNYAISDEYAVTSCDVLPPMKLLEADEYDDKEVMRSIPPLIKAYVSLGGRVSKQTYTDLKFKSVDLFVLVDLENCNDAYLNRILSL